MLELVIERSEHGTPLPGLKNPNDKRTVTGRQTAPVCKVYELLKSQRRDGVLRPGLRQDFVRNSARIERLHGRLTQRTYHELPRGRSHIRNTPKRGFGIGAFSEAEIASPSTSRVWAGSMIPSSHSRAVA